MHAGASVSRRKITHSAGLRHTHPHAHVLRGAYHNTPGCFPAPALCEHSYQTPTPPSTSNCAQGTAMETSGLPGTHHPPPHLPATVIARGGSTTSSSVRAASVITPTVTPAVHPTMAAVVRPPPSVPIHLTATAHNVAPHQLQAAPKKKTKSRWSSKEVRRAAARGRARVFNTLSHHERPRPVHTTRMRS